MERICTEHRISWHQGQTRTTKQGMPEVMPRMPQTRWNPTRCFIYSLIPNTQANLLVMNIVPQNGSSHTWDNNNCIFDCIPKAGQSNPFDIWW